MALPRWTWEVGTVVAVGVVAALIAREMLRPPVAPAPPAAAVPLATPAAAAPADAPSWYDPTVDPEALKKAYPTPFEPVPVERQRNYHKLYPAADAGNGFSTAY